MSLLRHAWPAARPRDGARRAVALTGLVVLGVAAGPLAAPGAALVPGQLPTGGDWVLGIYDGGLGVGGGTYYAFLWLAFGGYLAVLAGASLLPRRALIGAALVAIVAFALAPPLLSQDAFSYIDYARLGVDHGLNPYVHPPLAAPADPAFAHVGWPGATSDYGPVFTLASFRPRSLSP